MDTERLSKIWISWHVFFKEFVDRTGTIYLQNEFLWKYLSRTLLVDFKISTYLKTPSSQKYSLRFLIIDLKTSTPIIIHSKVHQQKYWNALVLIFLVFYHLEIPTWTWTCLFTFHSLVHNRCMHACLHTYIHTYIHTSRRWGKGRELFEKGRINNLCEQCILVGLMLTTKCSKTDRLIFHF